MHTIYNVQCKGGFIYPLNNIVLHKQY